MLVPSLHMMFLLFKYQFNSKAAAHVAVDLQCWHCKALTDRITLATKYNPIEHKSQIILTKVTC